MRTVFSPPILVMAAVLALINLTPAASAAEVVTTCQGSDATIVGTTGQAVLGTSGADVIVTNGASHVDAGAGDDKVCSTAMPDRSSVVAGTGDDSVLAEQDGYRLFEVDLGPGADNFVGGSGKDKVKTYDPVGEPHRDDTVTTGRGADRVLATRPIGPATSDADQIDLGPGSDSIELGDSGLAPEGRVIGGAGLDRIEVNSDDEGTDVEINTSARTITRDGTYLQAWTGVEHYFVVEFGARVTFTGSSENEHLQVAGGSKDLKATMGGGRDSVYVDYKEVSELHGGSGRDEVILTGGGQGPWIDLARGVAGSAGRHTATLDGFEDATAYGGKQPLVVGDAKSNMLAAGCGTVRGGGGADHIREVPPPNYPTPDVCPDFRAEGGAGDDVLVGSRGPDVLVGGAGHDRTVGLGGRDRCEAEVRRGCEVAEEMGPG